MAYSFMPNLRLALRLCFRHPLLSLAAIGSLALGIGANTAIFTTFALVAAVLATIAIAATLIPARRAMRIIPITALRE